MLININDEVVIDVLIDNLCSFDKDIINKLINEVKEQINFNDVKYTILSIMKSITDKENPAIPSLTIPVFYESVKHNLINDFDSFNGYHGITDNDIIIYEINRRIFLTSDIVEYMKKHNADLANKYLSLSFIEYVK